MNMEHKEIETLTREQMLADSRWRVAFLAGVADPSDDGVRYYVAPDGRLTQDFTDSQGNVLRAFWIEERFEWVGDDEMAGDWDS